MPTTFQDIFKSSFLKNVNAIPVFDMVLVMVLAFAVGLIPLAVFGSLLIGLILLVFSRYKSFDQPYILVIHCGDAEAEKASRAYVAANVKKLSLKSKSVAKGCIELNYEVRLKDADIDFINTLSDLPGVSHTVMVSYNGDYMS